MIYKYDDVIPSLVIPYTFENFSNVFKSPTEWIHQNQKLSDGKVSEKQLQTKNFRTKKFRTNTTSQNKHDAKIYVENNRDSIINFNLQ